MIRDPSDGSVKEKPVIETETSGLPIGKAKAEYLARLQASREWLKEYQSRPVAIVNPSITEE